MKIDQVKEVGKLKFRSEELHRKPVSAAMETEGKAEEMFSVDIGQRIFQIFSFSSILLGMLPIL